MISFHEQAGVFVVETRAKQGTRLGQHKHEHDHLAYLVKGLVRLKVDGTELELQAPWMLTIKAGKEHEVTALTDIVWLCLWGSGYGMQNAARESLKLVEA